MNKISVRCGFCSRKLRISPGQYKWKREHNFGGRVYCGSRCGAEARKIRSKNSCVRCGDKFSRRNLKQRFCSNACRFGARSHGDYVFRCLNCRKKTSRRWALRKVSKFCSRRCSGQMKVKRFSVVRWCSHCSRKIIRAKSLIKKVSKNFCNKVCKSNFRKLRKIERLSKVCERCGKTFVCKDINKRRNQRFCSTRCVLSGKSPTNPEKVVKQCLRNIGVKFVSHRNPLRRLTYPDFLLEDRKICIYADGDYWHKNNKKKDAFQSKVLRAAGYRVLRISESITKNQEAVEKIIEKYLAPKMAAR